MASAHDPPFAHSRESTLVGFPQFMPDPIHRRSSSATSTMSGPFMYADDLEPISDSFLSLYIEREPDLPESRIPYKPLLKYLKHVSLVREFRLRVRGIVMMVVEVGEHLFPPTYLLNEEIKKKVLTFTTYINELLEAVVNHLRRRIQSTNEAFRRLPCPAVTNGEQLALSISKWTKIIESLHKPTGRESLVFRELSAIYSSHVYQPFLQLRRSEPGHNISELGSQLAPISLVLRQVAILSDEADDAVRAIEEEFEATMTHQPSPSDGGARDGPLESTEKKTHHTPSKSAPANINGPMETVLRSRSRENTV